VVGDGTITDFTKFPKISESSLTCGTTNDEVGDGTICTTGFIKFPKISEAIIIRSSFGRVGRGVVGSGVVDMVGRVDIDVGGGDGKGNNEDDSDEAGNNEDGGRGDDIVDCCGYGYVTVGFTKFPTISEATTIKSSLG